jgi:hypothetical protein
MADCERHKADLIEARARHDRLKREIGLDVLEDRLEAAVGIELQAEQALVEHGFNTPVSIVAGLHRFAIVNRIDALSYSPAVMLRGMIEPLLKQVPAELADAFRRDWPLDLPGGAA